MSRVVLVTGASGGLGAEIATVFAQAGDSVVLACHTRPDVAEMHCRTLARQGLNSAACAADVADERQVEQLFLFAEERYGEVDVLVNCAGTQQQKMFCDTTLADWRAMMDVHVTGAFLCCRRAQHGMVRRRQGCIINVASMWGQVGASCEVAYSAAKAAVIGMTRALAKELAPSGVRINCIAPGAIDAGMMNDYEAADKAALSSEIPMGRLGEPQEVASTALFLASSGAGYITGQVLGVNGGFVV